MPSSSLHFVLKVENLSSLQKVEMLANTDYATNLQCHY